MEKELKLENRGWNEPMIIINPCLISTRAMKLESTFPIISTTKIIYSKFTYFPNSYIIAFIIMQWKVLLVLMETPESFYMVTSIGTTPNYYTSTVTEVHVNDMSP